MKNDKEQKRWKKKIEKEKREKQRKIDINNKLFNLYKFWGR